MKSSGYSTYRLQLIQKFHFCDFSQRIAQTDRQTDTKKSLTLISMTHVNILIVGCIVSETQTDRQTDRDRHIVLTFKPYNCLSTAETLQASMQHAFQITRGKGYLQPPNHLDILANIGLLKPCTCLRQDILSLCMIHNT